MNSIFEAHIGLDSIKDYESQIDARKAVEKAKHGYVVAFHVGFDGVARSCELTVYENGKWRSVDILTDQDLFAQYRSALAKGH